ncbi:MAG: peptidoglycan DD-metalloendopeptidase family protein [Rhodospirillales bacterium]|nr:peptidoglycan DD-metalloendopeptidase family protein [Rhodospirillales bacterium]
MRSPRRAALVMAAALALLLALPLAPSGALGQAALSTEDQRKFDALKRAEQEARARAAELKKREDQLSADQRKPPSAEELANIRRDRQMALDQAERLKAEIATLGSHLQSLDAAHKEQEEAKRRARLATERAQEQQKREEEAAQREARLRRERREAVEREQAQEREILRLESELRRLAGEEQARRAELAREGNRRDQVVAALMRLSGNEPAFLVAMPGSPLDNVQGALAFRFLERDLRQRSMVLNASLQSLGEARAAHEAARRRTEEARATLLGERTRLDQLLVESAEDQRKAAALRQRETDLAEKLRGEARDREELIAALVKERREREAAEAKAREEEKRAREAEERRRAAEAKALAEAKAREAAKARAQSAPTPPAQEAAPPAPVQTAAVPANPAPATAERPRDIRTAAPQRGAMINPVAGRIVRQFGQTDDAGTASKGLVFNAGAGARVVAPYDGQIVYAGPFRGFGRILIIEHSGGYHTMLSGLGRIDCAVGQWVVAGEPLAMMGDQGGAGLYVELRRDGQPVNPVPWLAAGNG